MHLSFRHERGHSSFRSRNCRHASEQDFPKLDNDLVLRAARGEPVERVPVWVMGQAGRCMEEFKEVRRKHDYLDICQDPYLACEMTLQPVEKLKVDAAVIFTDIMVVPIALGMKVMLKDDEVG